MTLGERSRELINQYCSGNLDAEQLAVLEQLLRKSPESRRRLIEYRSMESGLRASANPEPLLVPGERTTAVAGRGLGLSLAAMTAAAAVLLMALLVARSSQNGDIATVEEVKGIVQWTGDGGRLSTLRSGDNINGGTIESVTSDSAATIVYRDGSAVVLGGETLVVVSALPQKRVLLRDGNVSAVIQPQSRDEPFLLQTSTAKFEILGTSFEIDTSTSSTLLHVTSGAVRTTRKVDGTVVDVPADHAVVTGLDVERELIVVPRQKPVFRWGRSLATGSKDATGEWLPPQGEFKSRLRATPYLFQKENRLPQVIYRAEVLVPFSRQGAVELKSDSIVTVRGWLESSAQVEIMLNTRTAGRFGGNFFFRSTPPVGERFEIHAPVSAFIGDRDHESARVPPGTSLRKVVVLTVDNDAGLQVEGVEVIPMGSSPSDRSASSG